MEQPALSKKQAGGDSLSADAFGSFVTTDNAGRQHLMLAVDGMHCAACIYAIESNLSTVAGVEEARVNLSTRRLSLVWEGAIELAGELAARVEKLGYPVKPFDPAALSEGKSEEERFLLKCMAISGFAMGNIMLLSVALWSSSQEMMGLATRDLFHWVSALIALPTIFYAGQPFFRSALAALKGGHTNMDVPISLALILASGMSISETLNHGEHAYFDSAVMLLFFLLVGRYLDARARGKARHNAEQLLGRMAGVAQVIAEDDSVHYLSIKELREGMRLRVAAGEKIPTDCMVESGESEVDTSLMTGETAPQEVKPGDIALGGTINLSAPLTLVVRQASEDSVLADIVRLMEKAEQGRARYVRLAERAAALYTPVVHTLAAATFLGWWLGVGADWQHALLIAITVLIITCPCALGLAVPAVQVLASNWLMKRGILLKSGDALERLAAVDNVAFDKTGTLTLGKPVLVGDYAEDALQLAASLASHSRHPLAQAVEPARHASALPLEGAKEVTGMGIEASYQGKRVRLGRASWCGEESDNTTHSEIWLDDGSARTRFLCEDALRPDTKETLVYFEQKAMAAHILSGDKNVLVEKLAKELGVKNAKGGLLPAEKCAEIEALKRNGYKILMVGDGLNDAPALATAHVSISPASGIDITQNTADIVFQGSSLSAIARAHSMAGFSTALVKQNFALAAIYNMVAIPLAVMGHVTPLIAALAMSGSSLLVIANAFRINLKNQ